MRFSVVVCTYNRSTLLAGCLDALTRAGDPRAALEVIVVDNGSTDGTADLLARTVGVTVVEEPRVGVARARNAGLRAAGGELVAFIDDDARPEPGWVGALVNAAARHPSAVAFGGPVELLLQGPRPSWLGPRLEGWYSAVDFGPTPRLLAIHERPVGTNLAVKRAPALDLGGFDPRLGRKGSSLASEEEVELMTRLLEAGGSIAWVPDARVHHLVDDARLRRRWLLRRAWAQGGSDAVMSFGSGTAPSLARAACDAASAVLRGWRSTGRTCQGAADPQAAFLQDLMRRTRRLGRDAHRVVGGPRSRHAG